MKFVILIKVDTNPMTGGIVDNNTKFYWEVRELLKRSDETSDLLERTGPGLARGVADTAELAKTAAENAARLFASEQIYIFDTSEVRE